MKGKIISQGVCVAQAFKRVQGEILDLFKLVAVSFRHSVDGASEAFILD